MSLLTLLGEPDSEGYWKATFKKPGQWNVCVDIHYGSERLYHGNIFCLSDTEVALFLSTPGVFPWARNIPFLASRGTLEAVAKALEYNLLEHYPWVKEYLYPTPGKTALERILSEGDPWST